MCCDTSQQKGGDDEMSSLADSFKERVIDEKVDAEKRFRELDILYSNSLKCVGSSALPQKYLAYLKRERDLASMMLQMKENNLKSL